MSWASTFTDDLDRQVISPAYLVERCNILTTAIGAQPGGSPMYSSYRLSSYTALIEARSVYLGEHRIDVRSWKWSGGEWGFTLRWRTTTQRDDIRATIERGTPLQLRMGQASYAAADYEVIRLGVVADIVESGRIVTVRCWDLLSNLRTRIAQANWPVLFGGLTASAAEVLGVGYTVADTTITIGDETLFERRLDSGTAPGLVRITPDSGDPFLLKWTGTAVSNLTGATTAGQFGTTAGNAAAGNAAVSAALISGTPCEIARMVLTSTGDYGTGNQNGTDDVLPESWGYALSEDYIDATDMATWEALVEPATGAHAWDWIALDGDEAGIKTLTDAFARVGMWLCLRQGKVTMRCVQDIRGGSVEDTGVTITNADIYDAMSIKVEWRASNQPFEWLKARVLTATDGTTEGRSTNVSWPLEYIYSADLSAWIWTNEAAQRDAHAPRIKNWYTHIPEAVELTVKTMKWLAFVPGDVVYLNSSIIRGHLDSTATMDGTVPWMIESVTPQNPRPAVRLRLVTLPEDDADENV